jgi:BNR repeat-like domain
MKYIAQYLRISLSVLLFYAMLIAGITLLTAEVLMGKGKLLQKIVEPKSPVVKVVTGGESSLQPEDCLATLIGPDINQPDSFPGYGGFVGWVSPVRLKNGDWLVGFNAGYWHASAPTPLRYSPENLETYLKLGMPSHIVAPTGGRAMLIRSTDQGKTWSKPLTMLDTPDDDRHPAFMELPDGTLLCSLFTYPGVDNADLQKNPSFACRTAVIRSFDNGKTWDTELIRPPSPFLGDETNGPMVLLKDGSALMTIDGTPKNGGASQVALFTIKDKGTTWHLLSTVRSGHKLQEVTVSKEMDTKKSSVLSKEHPLDEANTVVLPDGQWVMMARPEGDICWSLDQGKTWTEPVTFGMRMYAPSLYVLRDGTLVCLHGSYQPDHSGLRVIFSTDGGHTWIAPAKDYGFLVSRCYGYAKAMELPDGSLFITDQDRGGHTTHDAQNMSIRCLRLVIRPDHSGIELLPAPNR